MRSVARGAAVVAALALGVGAWTPYAAAEPVDLGGQPAQGSTNPVDPTPLDAGLWTTMLGPEPQPQFFTYERQIQASTVHVGVIGAPQTQESDGISVAATVPTPDDAAGADCGSADATSSSTYPQAVLGAEVIVGDEDSAEDPCRTAAVVTIRVTRYSSLADDLPVAIKIVEEAPVSGRGSEIPEDDTLAYDPPEPAEPRDQPAGGESFDDAPVLDVAAGAVTIDAQVTEGTERLWRVPLDWGGQLVARVDLAGVDTEDELYSLDVQVELVQPSRDVFALTESGEYSYGYFGEEPAMLLAGANPLRYGNRFRDIEPTLPGDYWVAVSVEPAPVDGERGPVDVPVRLTIEVAETDVDAPTYQEAVLGQGGGAGPDGYSPETPYLVGASEFSAVASGNPFTPADDDDDETWWGPRRGVGLGLGVVSLAGCVVGAAWLTRRRAR